MRREDGVGNFIINKLTRMHREARSVNTKLEYTDSHHYRKEINIET
jgi:hypothetical protein